jgi:predicted dehydrogenase
LIVVGAGGRGTGYAEFAKAFPDRVRIVGVVEPRKFQRQHIAKTHAIAPENVFRDWPDLAAREKFADGAIIATPDALHEAPAVALAAKGYHLLLEKPMAPDEAACRRIAKVVEESKIILAVGHVMRYTRYTEQLKKVVDSGRVGEVVSMQHLEPVGYWHQAHSFVRGNWRNEAESSFMLLAKSCHDLDWIRYIMGARCRSVASFGSLFHFKKENRPPNAADRCLDCACESQCPYSAKKIYLGFFKKDPHNWPVNIVVDEPNEENLMEALRTGPYGRCVYACDNDVVDHQVVNMLFEGGKTASFTMTAFTQAAARKTRIFGTHGELDGDGATLRVHDFMTDKTEEIDATPPEDAVLEGHDGGDDGLMDCFVRAIAENNPALVRSSGAETLESHLMVFAAERARRENRVVDLD